MHGLSKNVFKHKFQIVRKISGPDNMVAYRVKNLMQYLNIIERVLLVNEYSLCPI
jgi:hypothetical protein